MVDHITKVKRSWNMSRIKAKDTKPEKIVRSFLFHKGFRFRIHSKDLPGKPDIVLPKYKTIIFVHGCFWHGHENCKRGNMPKSNVEYWQNKISRNIEKFELVKNELTALGWKVLVIWECQTKDLTNIEGLLNRLVAK